MNVLLTPELEKFIAEKVESGKYSSAEEVIREGLRLLREHEAPAQQDQVEEARHGANGTVKRLDIMPADSEDVLSWDVAMDVAPDRPSGSIEATLTRVNGEKPIPVEDPWSE